MFDDFDDIVDVDFDDIDDFLLLCYAICGMDYVLLSFVPQVYRLIPGWHIGLFLLVLYLKLQWLLLHGFHCVSV